MNRGSGGPTPLGIFVFVILIILLIVGAFFLFTGGDGRTTTAPEPETVTETTSDRAVRMTVYGNIVAEEERKSYAITISPDSRGIRAQEGYSERVVESETYRNNMSAYEEFVFALQKVGYDERRDVDDNADDPRGTCASGKRYVFDLIEFGDVIESAWTTTCGGSKGTFSGDYRKAENLFRAQIPDARDVLESVDMR